MGIWFQDLTNSLTHLAPDQPLAFFTMKSHAKGSNCVKWSRHTTLKIKSFVVRNTCLSWQNVSCCDKNMLVFVVMKLCLSPNICRNKHNFVLTCIFLSWQNVPFVMTKVCLSWQKYVCCATKVLAWQNLLRQAYFCHDKTCLSQLTHATNACLSWQMHFCHNKNYICGSFTNDMGLGQWGLSQCSN